MSQLTYKLPEVLATSVKTNLTDWQSADKLARLWRHDASLWSNTDEASWLGWLGITEDQIAHINDLKKLAADIKSAGFTDILLLGMGGSSLCPEVLDKTFGHIAGIPAAARARFHRSRAGQSFRQ